MLRGIRDDSRGIAGYRLSLALGDLDGAGHRQQASSQRCSP
jgi:hypothetical protein